MSCKILLIAILTWGWRASTLMAPCTRGLMVGCGANWTELYVIRSGSIPLEILLVKLWSLFLFQTILL